MADVGQQNGFLRIKFQSAVTSGTAGPESAFEGLRPGLMETFASFATPLVPSAETAATQPDPVPDMNPDINMEIVNEALDTDTPEKLKPEPLRSGLDAREVGRDIKNAEENIKEAREEIARVTDPKDNKTEVGAEAPGGVMRATAGAGLGLVAGAAANTIIPGILPFGATLALAAAPVAKEVMTQAFGQGSFGAPTASKPVTGGKRTEGYARSETVTAPVSDRVNVLLSRGPLFGSVQNVSNALTDGGTKLGPAVAQRLEAAVDDLSAKAGDIKESSEAFEKRAKGFTVGGAEAVQALKDRDLNLQGDSAEIKNGKLTVYNNMA